MEGVFCLGSHHVDHLKCFSWWVLPVWGLLAVFRGEVSSEAVPERSPLFGSSFTELILEGSLEVMPCIASLLICPVDCSPPTVSLWVPFERTA